MDKQEDKLGTAVRYDNPNGRKWFNLGVGRKIYIEPSALVYVQGLNAYDQHQVCRGIEGLASVPSPMNGLVNVHNPAFFKAQETSSTIFNFLIKYTLTTEVLIITRVSLDRVVLGSKAGGVGERQSLYSVKKKNSAATFSASSSFDDIENISRAWEEGPAVTKVKTPHAAVNGMLNDLFKASWLMGVHVEAAYPQDNIDKYTLFHNPTESGRNDFLESVEDNLGFTTALAKHLAAVLLDVQQTGEPVKWVVHSQGGIIFKQAVAHHLKCYPNQSLNKNSVSFHSGGHNKKETDKLLHLANIAKESPDNDNPFDMVPNLAGRNNMSLSGIKRSLQFAGKVMGSETSSPAESPHTLPFISLEAYHGFLMMAKDYKSAARVQKHMNELSNK